MGNQRIVRRSPLCLIYFLRRSFIQGVCPQAINRFRGKSHQAPISQNGCRFLQVFFPDMFGICNSYPLRFQSSHSCLYTKEPDPALRYIAMPQSNGAHHPLHQHALAGHVPFSAHSQAVYGLGMDSRRRAGAQDQRHHHWRKQRRHHHGELSASAARSHEQRKRPHGDECQRQRGFSGTVRG